MPEIQCNKDMMLKQDYIPSYRQPTQIFPIQFYSPPEANLNQIDEWLQSTLEIEIPSIPPYLAQNDNNLPDQVPQLLWRYVLLINYLLQFA